ncbi:MAG: transporter substrate-binding domain-containing protein [Kiritimatiellae bacterium]|nr:transporter substrate-binding domain-containing protein [Kiritimatiellia bacterium]
MKFRFARLLVPPAALLLAAFSTGCATSAPAPAPGITFLRVGFSPDYPPLCMKSDDGRPAGLEAELAAALAEELGCPCEIGYFEFKDLFDALLDGRVDILMSGLTVTPARAYRVRFCKPYMRNPLVAVSRAGWAGAYGSAAQLLSAATSVGVLRHTNAESFARQHCPRARIVHVSDYDTVPRDLADNRYSLNVDDLATLVDLAARNPGAVEIVPYPLQQQEIAWAVHPDNAALLSAANAAIDKWKATGRLDKMLDKWLPGRIR